MNNKFVAVMVWKPYTSAALAQKTIDQLTVKPPHAPHRFYFAFPLSFFREIKFPKASPNIIFGASSMVKAIEGSFTEKIAVRILNDAGAQFVLIDSSARKEILEESAQETRKKILSALKAGITPFLCIGENLQEHQSGKSEEIINQQIQSILKGLEGQDLKKIHLIYEAPWINHLSTAPTLGEIAETFQLCKKAVESCFDVRIPLYCGLPNDILETEDLMQIVQSDGYFFNNIGQNLHIFNKPLPEKKYSSQYGNASHESEVQITPEEAKSDKLLEEEIEAAAKVVSDAIVAASQINEEGEPPHRESEEEGRSPRNPEN